MDEIQLSLGLADSFEYLLCQQMAATAQLYFQNCPPNPVMAGFHPRNEFQLTLVVLFEVSIGAVPNMPKGHVNKRFQK